MRLTYNITSIHFSSNYRGELSFEHIEFIFKQRKTVNYLDIRYPCTCKFFIELYLWVYPHDLLHAKSFPSAELLLFLVDIDKYDLKFILDGTCDAEKLLFLWRMAPNMNS